MRSALALIGLKKGYFYEKRILPADDFFIFALKMKNGRNKNENTQENGGISTRKNKGKNENAHRVLRWSSCEMSGMIGNLEK